MKQLTFFFILAAIIGCKQRNDFLIEGQLPDHTFDGEFVFMVPFEDATKEKVDSVLISNGKFTFQGHVRKKEIFIIRTRPLLRLQLQEILIAKEPGTIRIDFGRTSSAGGTSLNDSLQHWKNHKILFDQVMGQLQAVAGPPKTADVPAVQQQIDSLQHVIDDFHFNFIKNNRLNIVGQLIMKLMGSSFSAAQKEQLAMDK